MHCYMTSSVLFNSDAVCCSFSIVYWCCNAHSSICNHAQLLLNASSWQQKSLNESLAQNILTSLHAPNIEISLQFVLLHVHWFQSSRHQVCHSFIIPADGTLSDDAIMHDAVLAILASQLCCRGLLRTPAARFGRIALR